MKRVIILGSKSFIASSIIKNLKKKNYKLILVDRKKCDFEKSTSILKLSKIIKSNDIVLFVAAIAPVKNINMFYKNILICKNVYQSLENKKNINLIYVSSDAVYSDTMKLIDENSSTEPNSLHGLMHLTREKMLNQLNLNKYTILRPTLVYGLDDPHDGYGPNKFFKNYKNKKKIYLFGKGEERRDHIFIDDVGRIITKLIDKQKSGIFNIVSGKVVSFHQIAKFIIDLKPKNTSIDYLIRKGKMPHNGYRAFNNLKIKEIYKRKILDVKEGIKKMHRDNK
tara:strand:- start:1452 stop:2294 length:843 start_codon:yes stop_codon:yes gene_type:complete